MTNPRVVNLWGKLTTIQTGDATLLARRDEVIIDSKKYKFGPTWSLFSLMHVNTLYEPEWDYEVNCASDFLGRKDMCMVGYGLCAKTSSDERCWSKDVRIDYTIGHHTQQWCWKIKVYNLTPVNISSLIEESTVSAFEYGGPNITTDGHVWSIELKGSRPLPYDYHATIQNAIPRTGISLSSLRYVEGKGLVATDTVARLVDDRPPLDANISVNFSKATCEPRDFGFFAYEGEAKNAKIDKPIRQPILNSYEGFNPFYVTRRGKDPILVSLINKKILNPQGNSDTWLPHMKQINYFDPCQKKFLTLTYIDGVYNVTLPPRERFVAGKPICVAIQDGEPKNNLVLYEMETSKTSWKPSNEFIGILTMDYIANVDLSVTTTSSIVFTAVEGNVDVMIKQLESSTNNKPELELTVVTSRPMKCEAFISSRVEKCRNIEFQTTTNNLLKTFRITDCLPLDKEGAYHCDGLSGFFYPASPLTYIKTHHEDTEQVSGKQETQPTVFTVRGELGIGDRMRIWLNGIFEFFGINTLGDFLVRLAYGVCILIAVCFFLRIWNCLPKSNPQYPQTVPMQIPKISLPYPSQQMKGYNHLNEEKA